MNQAERTGLARTQVLILAGGQGKRLLPLTEFQSKPAITFYGDFRIIDFSISNCLNSGLIDVSILTQYRHEELDSHIRQEWGRTWNRHSRVGESIRCLPPRPGRQYTGTANAVFQNPSVLTRNRSQNVVILSGDHVYRMDYWNLLRQHVETDADLTISTVDCAPDEARHFGVIEADSGSRVTGFEEKPAESKPGALRSGRASVNMGIYVFKTSTLIEALQRKCAYGMDTDFARDIIPFLIDSGLVYTSSFQNAAGGPRYWRDVGTIDSYFAASMDMAGSKPPFNPYDSDSRFSERFWRRRIRGAGASSMFAVGINDGASVHCSVLSPGVQIERNACVEETVLMPRVHVAQGVRLRRAIVLDGVHLPEGYRAGFDLQEDRKAHTVTERGVVVVSRTPALENPVPCVLRPSITPNDFVNVA